MNFKDSTNIQEIISDIRSEVKGNYLIIKWSYPVKIKTIAIILVPATEVFDENKIDSYNVKIIDYPESEFQESKNKKCYYLIYAYDQTTDSLIRQENNIISGKSITVEYMIDNQTLKLRSSDNLNDTDILYSINDKSLGCNSGVKFCLPCNLKTNTTITLSMPKPICLTTNHINIKLVNNKKL